MPLDWFFPYSGTPHPMIRDACARCPVQPECLADILAHERDLRPDQRYGFRAGYTAPQRTQLLREAV